MWLFYATIIATVFLIALSMDVPRLFGWGGFLLTFAIVLAILLAYLSFIKPKVVAFWSGASKKKKFAVACACVGFLMILNITSNHGKPDASINDFYDFCGICFALLLLGCYRIFSRFLDRMWARFSRR